MSKTAADNLSHEKIQQLLAAVGTVPQFGADTNLEAKEYDWLLPRYFSLAQLAKLEAFAKQAARECVQEFSRLYRSDVRVSVVLTTQCFQDKLKAENERADYYIAFGLDPQKPFGLIHIPAPSAALWAGQVLGSDDSNDTGDRTLSALEESILLDIAEGLIKDFSRAYNGNLQLNKEILRDTESAALQGSRELYMAAFEVQKADSQEKAARVFFLICCDKLHSVAGKTAAEEGKTAAADNARAMREHINHIPVSLTVRLAKTAVPFRDIVNLQVNDVIVLNKMVSDPIEVLYEDKPFFGGRPAQTGGKRAVVMM